MGVEKSLSAVALQQHSQAVKHLKPFFGNTNRSICYFSESMLSWYECKDPAPANSQVAAKSLAVCSELRAADSVQRSRTEAAAPNFISLKF